MHGTSGLGGPVIQAQVVWLDLLYGPAEPFMPRPFVH